jgi:hypothetical protein
LEAARNAKNAPDLGTELNILGMLYRQAGKTDKALACLNPRRCRSNEVRTTSPARP